MVAIEIFSASVTYKYKSKLCSLSSFVVLFFIKLAILTPCFVIYNAGGFWLRNRAYIETPDTSFSYKYLLLAERNININPIVCTTFNVYKGNKISDDCILAKVQEVDVNSDGKKDALKFEVQFYTDEPIKSLKLLLFFNFQLRQLFEATIESIATFDCMLNQEVQNVRFFGDLELHQKGLLYSEGLYDIHNHSIEMGGHSVHDLLLHNANKKFSAKISNTQVTWKSGYSNENAVTIHGELFYRENLIYYQPSIWEELKWAWIQYLSLLVVFAYIAKHILIFLFSNRYLNTYVVRPWELK